MCTINTYIYRIRIITEEKKHSGLETAVHIVIDYKVLPLYCRHSGQFIVVQERKPTTYTEKL